MDINQRKGPPQTKITTGHQQSGKKTHIQHFVSDALIPKGIYNLHIYLDIYGISNQICFTVVTKVINLV